MHRIHIIRIKVDNSNQATTFCGHTVHESEVTRQVKESSCLKCLKAWDKEFKPN